MNRFRTHSLVLLLLALFAAPLYAEEVKHLLVAKFLLARLETANLTPMQQTQFDKLSGTLRQEVEALRKEAGIDKEVMARRDEAHRALRGLKLDDDIYWGRLKKQAELNDPQWQAFKTTQEKFAAFKAEVNKMLTKEQRAAQKRPKKAKGPKADREAATPAPNK